jgi:hypothetical protein
VLRLSPELVSVVDGSQLPAGRHELGPLLRREVAELPVVAILAPPRVGALVVDRGHGRGYFAVIMVPLYVTDDAYRVGSRATPLPARHMRKGGISPSPPE